MAFSIEPGNLFSTKDRKEAASDFRPAPDVLRAPSGDMEFLGGAFPTPATASSVYDLLDLQRATQAYLDVMPHLSLYAIVKSQVRDFGLKSSSDIGVIADMMRPSENYLTGNDVTVYAVVSLDLGIDGPTVMEIPAGMLGNANDAAFEFLTDFGPPGPDAGKGGKYVFLPPDHDGDVPADHMVVRSPSYRVWAMMRGFDDVGTGDNAVAWFRDHLDVYPLATGPRDHQVVNVSGVGANTLVPEDSRAFDMLADIIDYEPPDLFDAELLGRLATLGIERGRRFAPDDRMRRIFDQAAQQAVAMSRTIVYASREPDIRYWPDRRWEKMFIRNTEFDIDGRSDVDARTLWHYQAICVSPSLLSTTPGVGTAYLTSFRDADGDYLLGSHTYRLRVPTHAPVARFWAVTAYDPVSRSLLDSGGPITVSSLDEPSTNDDGSVDIIISPERQQGTAPANWIKTDPARGVLLVFRFYGPLEGYIDKSWVLDDCTRIA